MNNTMQKFVPIEELIEKHRADRGVKETFRLNFYGATGKDVYNICQPFEQGGKVYLAGRAEARNSELSEIMFFEQLSKKDFAYAGVSLPMMQDPCACKIDGELIIGGTRIFADSNGQITNWKTTFFRGGSINTLKEFACAPDKMKDVRIVKANNTVHVFTRPQGGIAGPGRIGYTACKRLEDINEELISRAALLEGLFAPRCWGGVNEVHVLKNGKLGIAGHIAVMSEGDVRHYYGMTFCYDPKTGISSGQKIIVERADFEHGAYKRKDLIDVVFLGGIIRNGDGTATVYTGLSDAEAHAAVIADPFMQYEEQSL